VQAIQRAVRDRASLLTSVDHPRLSGRGVILRPVDDRDRARLREILFEPDVARWWSLSGSVTEPPDDDDDDEVELAIELDGDVVGAIQYAEETDPDYRHASIDIFLTTRVHGRGVGPEAIRTLARHLFADRGHHRLTIDPAASNGRAIAAYTKVGFRPVGIMRQYERGSDGRWHDGLLMDLLRDELQDEP
jgi:aminoglycoside 6'-N-acetyltransferase